MISIRTNAQPDGIGIAIGSRVSPRPTHHPGTLRDPAGFPLPVPAVAAGGSGNGWDGPSGDADDEGGDILYGAKAVADYLFPREPNRDRARRRVYTLADYYIKRGEPAGFFKLKSAVCLSKSQWRRFHGLG